jgi:hypothetical protein
MFWAKYQVLVFLFIVSGIFQGENLWLKVLEK